MKTNSVTVIENICFDGLGLIYRIARGESVSDEELQTLSNVAELLEAILREMGQQTPRRSGLFSLPESQEVVLRVSAPWLVAKRNSPMPLTLRIMCDILVNIQVGVHCSPGQLAMVSEYLTMALEQIRKESIKNNCGR